jgi:hypothetical protein
MSLFVAIVICVSGIQLPLPTPPMNTLFGVLLGFISGWGLFEVSEYRRRRRQQRTIREALKAELSNMERILNGQMITFAYGTINPDRGVQEMRWYFSEGLQRRSFFDIPIPSRLSPKVVLELSDDELTQELRLSTPQQPNSAVDLPITVLQAVLVAPTAGFTSAQLQRLSWVSWQTHLLAHEARMMKEMVMLTFTIDDPDNHRRVTENVEKAKQGYRMRAGYTMDAVREALKVIEK